MKTSYTAIVSEKRVGYISTFPYNRWLSWSCLLKICLNLLVKNSLNLSTQAKFKSVTQPKFKSVTQQPLHVLR